MNTHSIPIDVHRRLGLDNVEPSGLEGDRLLADGKAKAQEADRAARYMDLEPVICDLARLALAVSIIGEDLREHLSDSAKIYKRSDDLLGVCDKQLELLFAYIDDVKDDAQALRVQYYGRQS